MTRYDRILRVIPRARFLREGKERNFKLIDLGLDWAIVFEKLCPARWTSVI